MGLVRAHLRLSNQGFMQTLRMTALAACSALLLLVSVAPAVAQRREDSRITVSGAGGIAFPLHGDLDFKAPEWQIAVRAAVSRHFLLEGFFDEWRKKSQNAGLSFESNTTYTMRTVGVNWLARGFIDRAAFTGGGGIGFMHYDRLFEQSVRGCQSPTPASCQALENRFNSQSFTFQAVAGVEVPIASVISAFGQYQFVAPIEDVGFSHSSVTGGVRIRVW
jgi:hypothetical protein